MNPIKTKCYKVVRNKFGQLRSYLTRIHSTKYGIIYVPGQVIRGINKSKIFAFYYLDNARAWAGSNEELEVWEAEGMGLPHLLVWICWPDLLSKMKLWISFGAGGPENT
jgi:hypothetical protein